MTPIPFEVPTFNPDGTRLEPGEEGWWEVWGARPWHLRAGDRLITLEDGELVETDVLQATQAPPRMRLQTPQGVQTIGMGFERCRVFRWGTHNTLA
jgi:hypothetical protein